MRVNLLIWLINSNHGFPLSFKQYSNDRSTRLFACAAAMGEACHE
jgi:hypothetical protein